MRLPLVGALARIFDVWRLNLLPYLETADYFCRPEVFGIGSHAA